MGVIATIIILSFIIVELLVILIILIKLTNSENYNSDQKKGSYKIISVLSTIISTVLGASLIVNFTINNGFQVIQSYSDSAANNYFLNGDVQIIVETDSEEPDYLIGLIDDNDNVYNSVSIYNRIEGEDTWYPTVYGDVGDSVEFQMSFVNYNVYVENVMARVVLPNNLEYVEGTTVLYNSNHPNGLLIDDETLTTSGINIGNYRFNANAYVRFKAKIKNGSLTMRRNLLLCYGLFTVNGVNSNAVAAVAVVKE